MLFQNPMFLGTATSALLLSTSFVQGICVHNHHHNIQAGPGYVPISNFGYIRVTGPPSQAGINPEKIKCSTANVQSPINIEHDFVPLSNTHPQLSIPNVKSAEFENLGSMVEVVVNGTIAWSNIISIHPCNTSSVHNFIQWKCISSTAHLVSCWKNSKWSVLQTKLCPWSDNSILVLAALFKLSLTRTNANILDPLSTPSHNQAAQPPQAHSPSLTIPLCTDSVIFLIADTLLLIESMFGV